MIYGYLRTSTKAQNLHRQLDGLKEICDQLWVEQGVSGAAKHRPVFDRLMQIIQPGDMFVVWDLDRAFRSAVDALLVAKDLQRRHVGFKIVAMHIDTATPQGMYAYTVWAAGCEFERAILIERTRQGLTAAKKRGVKLGRRPKLTAGEIKRIQKLGPTICIKQLARQYNVSQQTVRRILKVK